ncbi:MAG: lysophospholipid acyltransferase family protein [Eubacteriales bacterium]|nr:lysophospholipid acyltransferase family protein [Eubacteriales bacterium]
MLLTLPLYLAVLVMRLPGLKSAHDRTADSFASVSARFLIWLTGSKVIVTGRENIERVKGPVVFVPNHQGHMDDTLLLGYIKKPKAFVSIVEVKKYLPIYAWMKELKCVFMDRSNIKQSVECINKAAATVRAGRSMIIFPEGKMSGSDELGEFKRGSLKLAIKAGAPVVPVTISCTHKVMTKNGRHIKPATLYMEIGEPIPTAGLSKQEEQQLPEKIHQIISGTMEKLHQNYNINPESHVDGSSHAIPQEDQGCVK